eukprot:1115818_1
MICDYCDKRLDSLLFRRRHLNSFGHKRAVKQWFKQFKTSEHISAEKQFFVRPPPCPMFRQLGTCQFGEKCPLLHGSSFNPEERLKRYQIEEELKAASDMKFRRVRRKPPKPQKHSNKKDRKIYKITRKYRYYERSNSF